MRISVSLTEAAILQELGIRIGRHRLESGLTQAALAVEAGVAKRTLERIEAGHGAELATVIRLLRVLKLIDGLEGLVPDQLPSPIALLKSQGRKRQRARSRANTASARTLASQSVRHSPTASILANAKLHSEGGISRTQVPHVGRSKRNKNWTWNE